MKSMPSHILCFIQQDGRIAILESHISEMINAHELCQDLIFTPAGGWANWDWGIESRWRCQNPFWQMLQRDISFVSSLRLQKALHSPLGLRISSTWWNRLAYDTTLPFWRESFAVSWMQQGNLLTGVEHRCLSADYLGKNCWMLFLGAAQQIDDSHQSLHW